MDKSVAQNPVDMTRMNSKLQFAEQLLQGIASATQELLTSPNFRESIQKALSILGQATMVDRVYIFKQHYDLHQTPLVSQKWEWVKPGVVPQIDNEELQSLPLKELFPRWFTAFQSSQSIAGLVENFPDSEREILSSQNILSIVAVPIHQSQSVWGFMGFDDCSRGHDWSDSEIAVLNTVANAFGGAFSRHFMEKQLLNANQDLLDKQFKLTQEKVKADQAKQAKQVFLGNISHELKTPLNGILGYSRILQRSDGISTEGKYGLERIHQSAMHLDLLVSNLLDATELESKDLQIKPDKVNLCSLLDNLYAIAVPNCDSKNIQFSVETPENLPEFIWTDETRLKQVLLNLINNAIKYTHQGSVALKLEKRLTPSVPQSFQELEIHREVLCFKVLDTGIGVSQEDQAHIFSLFSKSSSKDNQSEGAGLGLYISQRVINAFGSQIKVHSVCDEGSVFSFDLLLECIGSVTYETKSNKCYDTEDKIQEESSFIQSMSIPAPDELELLMHLTQVGQLNKVLILVDDLLERSPEMSLFCKTLRGLTKKYKVEEMELLISSALYSGE